MKKIHPGIQTSSNDYDCKHKTEVNSNIMSKYSNNFRSNLMQTTNIRCILQLSTRKEKTLTKNSYWRKILKFYFNKFSSHNISTKK